MLHGPLTFLAVLMVCLAVLNTLLSESKQRRVADWVVHVWAYVTEIRAQLATLPLFKIVLEDRPSATALATVKCFIAGLFGAIVFAIFSAVGAGALVGAILVNENATSLDTHTALLMWLYGAIALAALLGLFESIVMALFAIWAIVAASILAALSIAEILTRRTAEHYKGPVTALSALAAAMYSLLKTLT
jgi:hypothetical protein